MRAVAVTAAALVALGLVAFGIVVVVGALPAAAATKGSDVVTPIPAPGSQLAPHSHYYLLQTAAGRLADADGRVAQRQRPPDRRARRRHRRLHERRDRRELRHAVPAAARAPVAGSSCPTPEITLQPSEARNVDFTVHVPRDAAPGQYLGGSACTCRSPTAPTTVAAASGQATFGITLAG